MVAVAKKYDMLLNRRATKKALVANIFVTLFLIILWQVHTFFPFRYTDQYDNKIDRYNFEDDIKDLHHAISKLRGDDLRLVQWDVTEHTKKYQKKMCSSILHTEKAFR